MTKSALAISLAVLVSINAAAHSQSSVVVNPVSEGTAHPGTAILDSAGIYAGVPTPNVVPGASWDSPFGFNGHFCR